MAESLCCPKGHRWTPDFPPDVWPPDFRSACPICGEPPLGPSDVTARTMFVMGVVAVLLVAVGLPLAFLSAKTLPFGFILIILGVVILAGGLAVRAARARTKKMAAVADAMGFAFMPNLLASSVRALAPFRLFAQGHSQKAFNAMQGRVGDCDMVFFEYQYTTGSGKSSQTNYASCVVLFDGAAGVPDFQLAPRTFIDKLVGFFTHNTIALEDAGEFAKRCKLSGANEAALRRTFHPELTEYLGRHGGWFLQAVDGQLLLYRMPRVAPDKVPGLAADALEVRDLLRGAGRPAE